MICNNAQLKKHDNKYDITLPEDKEIEKIQVFEYAIKNNNSYVHLEISRVRKPKSIQQNKLFHALITEYYMSGFILVDSWQGA